MIIHRLEFVAVQSIGILQKKFQVIQNGRKSVFQAWTEI